MFSGVGAETRRLWAERGRPFSDTKFPVDLRGVDTLHITHTCRFAVSLGPQKAFKGTTAHLKRVQYSVESMHFVFDFTLSRLQVWLLSAFNSFKPESSYDCL